MRLDLSTWQEVEHYLGERDGILLPTGSIEQHGPIGLIGTDSLCAQDIATGAGELTGALVAPTIQYTPAPFNMSFPGTVSLSAETFGRVVGEVVDGLMHHGFRHIYVLNGHGANLEPLRNALAEKADCCRIKSWWDFAPVNVLRREWYGDWEGMHATPSEVAITQARHRVVIHEILDPPKQLSAAYMAEHAGDRHGPADEHRARFPDGRVGSHSSLATPEQGRELYETACQSVAEDFAQFVAGQPAS